MSSHEDPYEETSTLHVSPHEEDDDYTSHSDRVSLMAEELVDAIDWYVHEDPDFDKYDPSYRHDVYRAYSYALMVRDLL